MENVLELRFVCCQARAVKTLYCSGLVEEQMGFNSSLVTSRGFLSLTQYRLSLLPGVGEDLWMLHFYSDEGTCPRLSLQRMPDWE